MISKELVEQWYSLSKDSYEFAQRAAAHGAAQREKELVVEPVGVRWRWPGYEWTYDPFRIVESNADAEPLYTATQLAAARLQGAADERTKVAALQKQVNDLLRLIEISKPREERGQRLQGERVNQALLEALQTLVSAHGSILELSESPALKNARAAIAAAEKEDGK